MCATLRLIAALLPVWMTGRYVILFFSVLPGLLADSSTCRPCRSPECLAVLLAGGQLHVYPFPSYGDGLLQPWALDFY